MALVEQVGYGLLFFIIIVGIPSILIGKWFGKNAEDRVGHIISGIFYFIGFILIAAFVITAIINMSIPHQHELSGLPRVIQI